MSIAVLTGEEGGGGRLRVRELTEVLREDQRFSRKTVDVRDCVPRLAVAPKMIGPRGINYADDNVGLANRFLQFDNARVGRPSRLEAAGQPSETSVPDHDHCWEQQE